MGWFIWILAPLASSFIILTHGGGWSALPVMMSWFIPLIIFIVSFFAKNSYWKVSWLDICCLVFALIALYLWLIAKNNILATVFSITADACGFVPTIVKSWVKPQTEKPWPYIAGFMNALIGILSLHTYHFILYGMPLYLMIGNSVLIFVIYRRKIFKGATE